MDCFATLAMTVRVMVKSKTAGFCPPLSFGWMPDLDQLSKKLRSFRDLLGCFSLRSAFASI